jgi:hypothetical protein
MVILLIILKEIRHLGVYDFNSPPREHDHIHQVYRDTCQAKLE